MTSVYYDIAYPDGRGYGREGGEGRYPLFSGV